jgi:FkbM family methyltransferase
VPNVGQVALEYRESFANATIFAFEPIPDTYSQLVKNVSAQGSIRTYQLAFGNTAGQFEMHLYKGNVNNSLKSDPDSECLGRLPVAVKTLDNFCERESVNTIHLLKIDTEGFDLNVIRGASSLFEKNQVHLVVAELGFSTKNRKHVAFVDFQKEMETLGMELFGIYDQRREFDSVQSLRRADCMFICRKQSFPGLVDSPDV